MKKRTKIITLAVSGCLLLGAAVAVFAAYTFKKTVKDETAEVGEIEVGSKKFYSYEDSTNKAMRSDCAARLDDIVLATNEDFVDATTKGSKFQSSITYYVKGTYEQEVVNVGTAVTGTHYIDKDGGYVATTDTTYQSGTTYYTQKSATEGYAATYTVVVGTEISGDYYVKSITYTGIESVGKAVLKSGTALTATVDESNNKIINVKNGASDYMTITCVMNETNGIGSATVTSNDVSADYKAVIDTDYMGMVVLDNNSDSKTDLGDDVSSVTCSATEAKNTDKNIYLNQLGFGFTFTNEVAVYVRIHIQDAWVSIRQYSSNIKKSYSIKDQVSGNSPFAVTDDNWYYNVSENTAYLKVMVDTSKDEDGAYVSHTYTFDVNQAYYYIPASTNVYKEYMDVEVSFTVDIVQANRAKDLWGFDPSSLAA